MKVLYINQSRQKNIITMDKNAQLYPHFKLYELANNKGKTTEPQYMITPETDAFMMLLEEFRVKWAKSMTCNSCYRQPEFNKSVGGASNSLHLQALAFDWGASLTGTDRTRIIKLWEDITKRGGKIGGINLYNWGCHLDANEEKFGNSHFVVRNYL